MLNFDILESEDSRNSFKNDLKIMSEKMICFEEDLFESKSIQLELLEQLKEVEEALELSDAKLGELIKVNEQLDTKSGLYIAHKNDKVDQNLGNYLNTYPERKKMNIMFLRESEGVY